MEEGTNVIYSYVEQENEHDDAPENVEIIQNDEEEELVLYTEG